MDVISVPNGATGPGVTAPNPLASSGIRYGSVATNNGQIPSGSSVVYRRGTWLAENFANGSDVTQNPNGSNEYIVHVSPVSTWKSVK